jgi:hypothetical protein
MGFVDTRHQSIVSQAYNLKEGELGLSSYIIDLGQLGEWIPGSFRWLRNAAKAKATRHSAFEQVSPMLYQYI